MATGNTKIYVTITASTAIITRLVKSI